MEIASFGCRFLFSLCFFSEMIYSYPTLSSRGDGRDPQSAALLFNLLQGPLANDNILFAFDAGAYEALDFGQVSINRKDQSSIILISTEDPLTFLQTAPIAFLRGHLMTAVIVFMKIPETFLDSLDRYWNPAHLLLINLNLTVNAQELLEHGAIQRSKKIALIEKGIRGRALKFFIYTSKPFKVEDKWKARKDLVGVWETHKTIQTKEQILPGRFSTFDGAILNLGSWCDDFPFLYSVEGNCFGTSLDLLDIIATKVNFTYNVQMETADQNWGSKENGTWTGMLGDLVYNDKDLVVNYFLLTEENQEDFDTTATYYSEGFGFALKSPPPMPQWPGLLYPFTGVMWVTTICTVAVVALLLTVCLYAVPEEESPSQAFLLIFGGIVKQSIPYRLETSWSRFWMGWWWLAAMIITTGYTSNLVAFLTVPVYPSRIETIDELAASGLRVSMQDYGDFLPDALKISSDPSLYKLGHSLDFFPYEPFAFRIGFGWVLNDTHALVDTYSYLVNIVEDFNHTDSTYFMKEIVYPSYLTWFLQKNCPYTEVISDSLTRLVEAGLVNKLYMKHMIQSLGKDREANRDKVSESRQLQLGHLLGAFILWAIGIGLALTAFAWEQTVNRL